MNVVIWARVSSREQREGYSIDAQLRATRERAAREGWKVVREFAVAESAKRGAERLAFNEMFAWVRQNARREGIAAILSHKLDRACRNMRDAVRLQDLEDTCGVRLAFVENQFGPGAAGALSFNVMAAVAQYYSDNLRTEVLKGMDEKVRQGWPTGLAPFGYVNTDDRDEPIKPHPEKARTVVRIFELYARGTGTFKSLADQLQREGHVFRPSQPRFNRTSLSYILNNRFYVGDLSHRGKTYPGKHKPLIDRRTFQACQDILGGRNRRTGNPDIPYSGGLFRCAYCGAAITGELIRRRLGNGDVNVHVYYKCRNTADQDHPDVRWRLEDLEAAFEEVLGTLVLPSTDVAAWFREALQAAFADVTAYQRRQRQTLGKRQTELRTMQDRLLTAYLEGTVDEVAYERKSADLKAEAALVEESLQKVAEADPKCGETALAAFDFSQTVVERWRGSNFAVRREIVECVCSNRTLSDVSLCVTKRKPFDALAERPSLRFGRGDWI